MSQMKIVSLGAALVSLAILPGCATSNASSPTNPSSTEVSTLQQDLEARNAELERSRAEVERLQREVQTASATPRSAGATGGSFGLDSGSDLLPPNAKPGECYARAFIPPTYKTQTEQVIRREASSRVETLPARYEKATERVLIKEASSKLVTVPATYETVTERVQTESSRTFWRLGKSSKSREADDTLISEASKLGLDLANARPGSCYDERLVPARYESRTEKVLTSEASSRVDVIPAKFEMAEERVLVREAGTRIVEVPATYETQTERVLVKPATTVWKKGSGPIQRVDDSTGEIMCLVEVPAEYRTVTKRVLKTPASTKTIEIPAEYKTVKVRRQSVAPQERRIEIPAKYSTVSKRDKVADARRYWVPAGKGGDGSRTGRQLCMAETPARHKTVTRRVVKTPAGTKTVSIPAEYKTVTVNKLATPASTKTIEIPAEYATVTKKVKVTEGNLEWRPVLCETNANRTIISQIQRALTTAGHNAGPADGVIGRQTLDAIASYQEKNRLPKGGLNYETISALGVKVGR